MSVDVSVLASGSGGNCTVVRSPGGVMLIDAGIGPRTAAGRLAGMGVGVADVQAVCLTHLDHDHINANWFATFARRGVRLFCHVSCVTELLAMAARRGVATDVAVCPFDAEPFEVVPGLVMYPLALSHDAEGSHGFVIDGYGCRVGFATDLGHVPDALVEGFGDVDLLAIESNYDQRMQIDSPRPWHLKRRIMGGRGHLSNAQAFDAVRRVFNRCEAAGRCPPEHVVLLHRSRDCNCPELLRRLFARDARVGPRLVLTEQDAPTPWLRAARRAPLAGAQLSLAWG